MNIEHISVGDNPPHSINVIIEVTRGGEAVKYELDKNSGALFVDRVMHTSMRYPCNYGFTPHTLSDDGDPLDVMVVADIPFMPGCVVQARPIGVLLMKDESGQDEKIIAVPTDAVHPHYTKIRTVNDLPEIQLKQIAHFFTHYKDLESGKWVELDRWGDVQEAQELVQQAIARASQVLQPV